MLGIDAQIIKDTKDMSNVDFVLVLGGDKGILHYFHKIDTDSPPVVGIYESDSTGFLAQIDAREIKDAINRLKRGDYDIDEVTRIAVKIDGRDVEPALNDVAIFPSRSAILMEHKLRINGEDIWHDNSDGVVIATPIGSTAYSMSAGGPMVLRGSKVFVIVSINSIDVTRRPLIVSDDSNIEIDDIISRYHCEVILDGDKRIRVKKKVTCFKHEHPARLIKFANQTVSLIAKKVKLAEDMLGMPPSAKLVLKILEYEGPMSQRDLADRTMLPERTVRLALSHLLNKGYVKKRVSLRDARQRIYELKL
ncbi:MAG: winged helix-turn-helix transcriptional regulator [Candidatus Nitrosothermus koennekii]|nr:MAG: winged helix-turn-helix transcriptional regulator [Candidatus Nitrosothermus koennekii]